MPSTPRYLCIHGHFYQPPRENPWLGVVEEQPSAAPSHDWNERVATECYLPNAAARILGERGGIRRIVNNYELMSFNFGPTLLDWAESTSPELHEAVLRADRTSVRQRGGCGNALAQVYNHVIMPLESLRDKRTQVRWGIRDFERRFKRRPEGMWLAETAVDEETLEVLADEGLRFTILAPHQARAVRPLAGNGSFEDLNGVELDPSRPYLCRLSGGREIIIFFYDGPISRAVAFDGLLQSGAELLERILAGYSASRAWPQVLTIAVDGETFGHHSRFGEMALAWVFDRLLHEYDVVLTNPAEYLARHTPDWEVRIAPNTSWSCAHGIERWRSDCGCRDGDLPGAHQRWRAPLREALEDLRARLDLVFESGELFADPWAARDDYLTVLGQSDSEAREAFFVRHSRVSAEPTGEELFWTALEMQRCGMLMFTSCAWFFDEVSRIEVRQVLAYAARAIHLARAFDLSLEERFLASLARAPSNCADYGDAAEVYRREVKPLVLELERVVAGAAITALARGARELRALPRHRLQEADVRFAPNEKWMVGSVTVRSSLTTESRRCSFAAVLRGRYDYRAAVGGVLGDAALDELHSAVRDLCAGESPEAFEQLIGGHLEGGHYRLDDVTREERRRVLCELSRALLISGREEFERIRVAQRHLMEVWRTHGGDVPDLLGQAVGLLLRFDVARAVRRPLDQEYCSRLRDLFREARHSGVKVESDSIERRLSARVAEAVADLRREPGRDGHVAMVEELLALSRELGLRPDLWRAQNEFLSLLAHGGRSGERLARLAESLGFEPDASG